jgi:hypothetical protein
MPTSTKHSAGDDDTRTAGGIALYNSIMSQIEPDLVTTHLQALYPIIDKDTPEQRKERAARYTAAFMEYEKRFRSRNTAWDAEFKKFKHEAMHAVEEIVLEEEAKNLSSLESSISSSVSQ